MYRINFDPNLGDVLLPHTKSIVTLDWFTLHAVNPRNCGKDFFTFLKSITLELSKTKINKLDSSILSNLSWTYCFPISPLQTC